MTTHRSGRAKSRREFFRGRSSVSLLVGAVALAVSGIPSTVDAQEIPVTVVEDSPTVRAKVGPVPRGPRPKLEWRTVYRALTVVIPLEFACCRIPSQFTLTPRAPYLAWGNRGAALNLTYGEQFITHYRNLIPYINLLGGTLEAELFNLTPDSRYLFDFRVEPTSSWEVSLGFGRGWNSVGVTDSGHILAVVETNSEGDAVAVVRGGSFIYDVTVSELGTIP